MARGGAIGAGDMSLVEDARLISAARSLGSLYPPLDGHPHPHKLSVSALSLRSAGEHRPTVRAPTLDGRTSRAPRCAGRGFVRVEGKDGQKYCISSIRLFDL